ncbi:MAG TPA: membrane dipeptidase [Pyrinomonadaceae bacterium]|jgi:membrane dipeptidase|nr:membrane dipeptidase [Pyrinomonadaceae bacterium]
MNKRKLLCGLGLALACVFTLTGRANTGATAATAAVAATAQVSGQQPAASPTPARDERLWREAQRIHRRAVVVDTHNDITSPMVDEGYDIGTPSAGKYHTDIARMKAGGLDAEFFSIYVDKQYAKDGGSARRAMDMIDMVYRAVERHPNDLLFATSVADIRSAAKQRKIAALMGIEGGHAIENSLMALRDFYRLGIRYMTLTHNNTNDWADSARDEARHNGLTEFGKEVVREMNRIGMLVDVSHVSDKTMSDVLDTSRAPIIASHSSARALNDRPRNIPDDLLRRIAKNGGVVMVNFYPGFIDRKYAEADDARAARLKPQLDALGERFKNDPARLAEETKKLEDTEPLPPTPLSVLIDHIDHIAKVAGVDHVGLGSDFDGVPILPEGMKDVSELPNITYELLRRGYSEKDIRKVLGENFLRVFSEAERVARSASRTISGDGSVRRMESSPKK